MIEDVSDANIGEVRRFLETHLDSSIFLLHTLERFGPAMVEHRDSGNFRCLLEDGRVAAVISATRRGHLLVQTGGREDLGGALFDACADHRDRLDGVVGEWRGAQSVWTHFRRQAGFRPTYEAPQVIYRMLLDDVPDVPVPGTTRRLDPDDFDLWYPLFHALEVQEGVHIHGDREEVRSRFASAPWRWWGRFQGSELAAVACVDLTYHDAAHIGGIYVVPAYRRRGLAAQLLHAIAREAHGDLAMSRLVLFTRESNVQACRLYERLGFVREGSFGFLLGTREG